MVGVKDYRYGEEIKEVDVVDVDDGCHDGSWP